MLCCLELIDDLCSALPPDVFSHSASMSSSPASVSGVGGQSSGNNRPPGSATVINQSGPGVGGGPGPNNGGIETQHPNLTGLLTNSNLTDQVNSQKYSSQLLLLNN